LVCKSTFNDNRRRPGMSGARDPRGCFNRYQIQIAAVCILAMLSEIETLYFIFLADPYANQEVHRL
jgi:hypothetical protein